MELFTAAWCDACCARLNARGVFLTVGAGWKGGVVLEMTAGTDLPRHAVFLDLHDGGCRGARPATEADRSAAAYVLRGDSATWRELLAGSVDPVPALVAGRLRLARGNLLALAKYAAAARELVAAAGEVGGAFPSAGEG